MAAGTRRPGEGVAGAGVVAICRRHSAGCRPGICEEAAGRLVGGEMAEMEAGERAVVLLLSQPLEAGVTPSRRVGAGAGGHGY